MVDTFQCTDGKPITESPLYDWQNPWANRDPRLDLFCLRPDTRLGGAWSQVRILSPRLMENP